MKRKGTRYIALLLMIFLVAVLFTACGEPEKEEGEPITTATVVGEVTESTTEAAQETTVLNATESTMVTTTASTPETQVVHTTKTQAAEMAQPTGVATTTKKTTTTTKRVVATKKPTTTTTKKSVATTQPTTKSTAAEKVLSVSKLPQKTVTADKTKVITYTGNMQKKAQEDTYTYTAQESGRVRFELNEMRSGLILELNVYNRLGERVEYRGYCTNNAGITLKVEKGETYTIEITYHSGSEIFGTYELNIWQPKAPISLDACSAVKDSIEFIDQRNLYTFTVPMDGRYSFYITEMKANQRVSIYIFNYLDEEVASCSVVGTNVNAVVTDDLKAGETYVVQVIEYNFDDNRTTQAYTLNVGKQKKTEDITAYNKVKDSIEYERQINRYTFTVPQDGSYSFKLTEMQSNLVYEMGIYNYLEEEMVRHSYMRNGTEIYLENVKKGEQYTILLTGRDYDEAVGSYVLEWQKM